MSERKTELSYEQTAERLQALLVQLEDESTPLAKSIELYAEAAQLIAVCHSALEHARLEIEQIDLKLAKAAPTGEE